MDNKVIYMLFAGREVRIGKDCARGLEYGSRPQDEGRAFPIRTDLGREITCLFFISGNFVDFLLQQFYTVRVRLTFRSSRPVLFTEVFKRRDSVFADFKTEQ